ncbi:MAG: SDR family oxidoreductase [Bacteroidales bacterium]|nr:SDR family oxidoreductase [Bacteroidales bacterium]
MMKFILNFFKYIKWCKSGGYAQSNISLINCPDVLKGKKVLVTGGSDGIGLAIAKKFISSGASVVITGRSIEKLARASAEIDSDNLHVLQWDICNINLIKSNINRIQDLLGGIDIVVNNAAFVPSRFEDPFTYDKTMDTNAKSVYWICYYFAEYMKSTNGLAGGKIINISSLNAFEHGMSPYFISKRAVNAITEGFAKKYSPYNIIVNGIAPGFCNSNINKTTQGNDYCERSANGCIVYPSQIAELACFLASGASNGIIGQTIVCDNGALL